MITATPRGYFITGTDTGVGKTLAACALLHGFAHAGQRAVGMKPVAAGAARGKTGLVNDDVELLKAASNFIAPAEQVNPYCFEPPIAPHLAAAQAGITIDVKHIARAYASLAAMADMVVVEGAGGFCVPLNSREDSADLACALALPVILVVGVRLGCLNHALLTAQAVRARGLALAGWIANRNDPTMAEAAANINALVERLPAPLLGAIDFMAEPDARKAAAKIDCARLQ